MDNDLGTVTIGAREIYDELVAMRSDVRSASDRLSTVATTLADHEDRLRSVERFRYSLPAAMWTAGISAATTIITVILKLKG